MAVIVSERPEAADELQPETQHANPIIAQVTIEQHISLFRHSERCSHRLMEVFSPLIPRNVHQITISELNRGLCSHTLHPITLHRARAPHRRCGLLITFYYTLSFQMNKVLVYSLSRSSCPLVSIAWLVFGTQMVSTRSTKESRKTAVCSISRAACYALRVGAARESEPLEKLRKEIEN